MVYLCICVSLCCETETCLIFPHSCGVLDYGKPAAAGVIPPRSAERRLSPSEGQRASSRNRGKLFRITLNTSNAPYIILIKHNATTTTQHNDKWSVTASHPVSTQVPRRGNAPVFLCTPSINNHTSVLICHLIQ